MTSYGCARVSTLDQDLTVQRQALRAAGCGVIRAEKASGSRRDRRTELQVLLDFVQPGDRLVVTRIAIARSSHRMRVVSQPLCVERSLPSQIICAENDDLLRLGSFIIARHYK
jgi:DNA invertase Pin-like site-specific DNA recombinase